MGSTCEDWGRISGDVAIVGCTISLRKLLGLRLIAEGIEDATTLARLERMGCEEGQGYYFSPPLPAAEFERKFLAHGAAARLVGDAQAQPAANAA